ncbi:MAG: hypothetical protein PHU71_00380 [Candidatus Gracilibacteria bacterium]|nr:hypothetical protein [Candidatus Gracilibacteria bacterium]
MKGIDELSQEGPRNSTVERLRSLFGRKQSGTNLEGDQKQEPEKPIMSKNPLLRIKELGQETEEYRELEAQINNMSPIDFQKYLKEAGYEFPNDSQGRSNTKIILRFRSYIDREENPVIKEKLQQLFAYLRNPSEKAA